MPAPDLFPEAHVVGVFRGFREGGLEFHADLALPYRTDFHNVPMHGQFVLVQLETPDEAVLGRITSLSSEGRLASGSGEEFSIRAVRERRLIPEGLREDYLKYRVNIRVLGLLRRKGDTLVLVPSHRRLPHVGSPVAFPSDAVIREIVGHNLKGAEIGFFALGEFVYAKGDSRLEPRDWMQIREPCALVRFPIEHLVKRRTFVFARAGFGKSNLNKLLFSKLYATTPTIEKRGRHVPVGTIIFDPDGEYFWPDDSGRPGLCDVPELRDNLVVFASRPAPSAFYGSFVAGTIKLDIRRLRPSDVITIGLPPERQDQQNVRKLRGLDSARWEQLVDLIWADRNGADLATICELLDLDKARQEAEALAARGNMTSIVGQIHDPSSRLLDLLLIALRDGKLCIVDVSQLRGGPSMMLSGLILRRIFDWNQEQFTRAHSESIPTIAVVEEAQSVLNDKASAATPYIEWVKEGRKYDLGAMLITQQPGSIPVEILSQGDNWFIFHLLSSADLQNVRRANAHFSEDLLSSLLNEPIPGQGVFWSSVGERPYPVSVRILSFERMFPTMDPHYNRAAVDNYAAKLRTDGGNVESEALRPKLQSPAARDLDDDDEIGGESAPTETEPVDRLRSETDAAVNAIVNDAEVRSQVLTGDGIPWGVVMGKMQESLPASLRQDKQRINKLIARAIDQIAGGPQNIAWHAPYRPRKTGGTPVLYIVRGAKS